MTCSRVFQVYRIIVSAVFPRLCFAFDDFSAVVLGLLLCSPSVSSASLYYSLLLFYFFAAPVRFEVPQMFFNGFYHSTSFLSSGVLLPLCLEIAVFTTPFVSSEMFHSSNYKMREMRSWSATAGSPTEILLVRILRPFLLIRVNSKDIKEMAMRVNN
jgi:hypothetical protein